MDEHELTILCIQVAAMRKRIRNMRIVEERRHRRTLRLHAVLILVAITGLCMFLHQGVVEASLPVSPELTLILLERIMSL